MCVCASPGTVLIKGPRRSQGVVIEVGHHGTHRSKTGEGQRRHAALGAARQDHRRLARLVCFVICMSCMHICVRVCVYLSIYLSIYLFIYLSI